MRRKVLAAAVGIAVMVGVKAYSRAATQDEVRELLALCEGDGVCEQAIETHFDVCSLADRSAAGTGSRAFAQCLNARAGRVYFVYGER
jgi:hypothetical protein